MVISRAIRRDLTELRPGLMDVGLRLLPTISPALLSTVGA